MIDNQTVTVCQKSFVININIFCENILIVEEKENSHK